MVNLKAVFALNLISMCVAEIIYHDHEPITIYHDGYSIHSNYPYHYGPYKYGVEAPKTKSFTDELREYGKVFVETFQKSYKDLNKPYVVIKHVPVPVPGNTIHTTSHSNFLSFNFFFNFLFFNFQYQLNMFAPLSKIIPILDQDQKFCIGK